MELRRSRAVLALAFAVAAFAVVAIMPVRADAAPRTVNGDRTELNVPFSLIQHWGRTTSPLR